MGISTLAAQQATSPLNLHSLCTMSCKHNIKLAYKHVCSTRASRLGEPAPPFLTGYTLNKLRPDWDFIPASWENECLYRRLTWASLWAVSLSRWGGLGWGGVGANWRRYLLARCKAANTSRSNMIHFLAGLWARWLRTARATDAEARGRQKGEPESETELEIERAVGIHATLGRAFLIWL